MTFQFQTDGGQELNYAEASEVVRYMIAEHLEVDPDRLSFLMVDVSDPFFTKTYFHCELDGDDLPPEVDQKVRGFIQSLGFGQLGLTDVLAV